MSGENCCSGISDESWIIGTVSTKGGLIPIVSTRLNWKDRLGSFKARWGINRMNYQVPPGLYGVGQPDDSSVVLVTANYKMTFDQLRKELAGINAWILVLDTKGINVWCAAGKGTFGTRELIYRMAAVNLWRVVSHRSIILPQLGAPGVAAHEVQKITGFKVAYGPVRAEDIPEYLEKGQKATPAMRRVRFGFLDRLILTPVELAGVAKPVFVMVLLLLLAHITGLLHVTLAAVYHFIGAVLMGAVVTPVLLPWIPGRAFAWKGWVMGILWAAAVIYLNQVFLQPHGVLHGMALLLLLPAISAYLAMNFTGASTYTSLSGVKKEMKIAVPAITACASLGFILMVVNWLV